MNNISLAIIVPVYNGEIYIGKMLDSILQQTYNNWKLIIVDDGSTDATITIISDYLNDNRITLLKRDIEPKGAQTCRNMGLKYCGDVDYVIFFDADDIVAPYCIEQRTAYMEAPPNLDFAIFPSRTFADDIKKPKDIGNGIDYFMDNDLSRFFWGEFPYIVWNNIYRRNSLLKNGIRWDEKVLSLQDTDFNIQCILAGLKYEYANGVDVDYYYRYISDSKSTHTKVLSKEHLASHAYLLSKIIHNLNVFDRINYCLALQNYIIIYVKRFATRGEYSLLKQVLGEPWVHSQRTFGFRLFILFWLSNLLHRKPNSNKLYFLFFPRLCLTYKKRQEKYKCFMKSFFASQDSCEM